MTSILLWGLENLLSAFLFPVIDSFIDAEVILDLLNGLLKVETAQ